MSRVVLHVDMDCFYAACEQKRNPELDGEPVVVGMGYTEGSKEGVVATASYEAREHGVHSTQRIEDALQDLPRESEGGKPEGVYLPADRDYYEEISERVMEILGKKADVLREVSVDEAYLDVTEKTDWDRVEQYAKELKGEIDTEVGVTASVGVAPNMSAAKIASDYDKPDGICVVNPEGLKDFLGPLDVEKIHRVGPKTAEILSQRGVETANDLSELSEEYMKEEFGQRGLDVLNFAKGKDTREVTPKDPPKSLLRDSALEVTEDWETKSSLVRELARDVAESASEEGAMYKTIGIKVVLPPFENRSRMKSMSGPIDDPDVVEETAIDLLEEFRESEVRKLGVRVSNLVYADQKQSGLSQWNESDDDEEVLMSDKESEEKSQGGQSRISEF
jgi:DNA polymerase IV (DinB-like DNA polymerase)